MMHVVRVNQRAFRLEWCPKCLFHRPPRTYHCPWCNICVEVSIPSLPVSPRPGQNLKSHHMWARSQYRAFHNR